MSYVFVCVKAHKLIHTGHKPVFQCELCPTTCGRKTDLKYHVMKLHTSDRPLQCRKCGKAFPDRYTYKVLFAGYSSGFCSFFAVQLIYRVHRVVRKPRIALNFVLKIQSP